MFTVYDLTLAVRQAGEWLKHEDSRVVVHEMFETGVFSPSYTRTQVRLNGVAPCYVYHDGSDDPSTYTNAVSQVLASLSSPSTQSAPVSATNVVNPNVLTVKSRLRLTVPNSLVRTAGLVAGDEVYVENHGDSYTISSTPNNGTRYTVDKDGNIRFKATLSKVQTFTASVVGNDIVVDGTSAKTSASASV